MKTDTIELDNEQYDQDREMAMDAESALMSVLTSEEKEELADLEKEVEDAEIADGHAEQDYQNAVKYREEAQAKLAEHKRNLWIFKVKHNIKTSSDMDDNSDDVVREKNREESDRLEREIDNNF